MTEPTPEQPAPKQPAPERIVVSYALTSGEYARYVAAVVRRSGGWKSLYILVAIVFLAIPVALLFRFLAAQSLHDSGTVRMVGDFSLCAYGAGVAAAMIWGSIARLIMRKRYYEGTVARRQPKTAVIDSSQIAVSFPGVETKWQWTVVQGCSIERGLLLVWFETAQGAAIPCRCFESRDGSSKALAFIRARLLEAKRAGTQPLA